ncbi:hypothetical protein [Paraburkholderia dinghuensis]|uniref:hypothetical protein n=1 Tax=Paraburkholderia dinghuensis TaxID=2305225 RepID=UPI0016285181|nr:hypothetical protein [Paraburkholderia dinghuensis]
MRARRIEYLVVALCGLIASTYGLRALTVTTHAPASSSLPGAPLRAAQHLAAGFMPIEKTAGGDGQKAVAAKRSATTAAATPTAGAPHTDNRGAVSSELVDVDRITGAGVAADAEAASDARVDTATQVQHDEAALLVDRVAGAGVAPDSEAPSVAHDEPARPVAAPARSAPLSRLASLRAPLSLTAVNNPFISSSWLPPAPKVDVPEPPPPPPPPPMAPPLPFAYLGQLDAQAAKPQVFLSNGDDLLIVSTGDVIDARYRVESISDAEIVMVYLPLNQRQVISMKSEGN